MEHVHQLKTKKLTYKTVNTHVMCKGSKTKQEIERLDFIKNLDKSKSQNFLGRY